MPKANGPEQMHAVVSHLITIPSLVVAGGIETNLLEEGAAPDVTQRYQRTLDIYAHPANPLYEAGALNDFMSGLIPKGIEPAERRDFLRIEQTGVLTLGRLVFDETIGAATMSTGVKLKDNLQTVQNGDLPASWDAEPEEVPLKQQTTVRLFPDEARLLLAAFSESDDPRNFAREGDLVDAPDKMSEIQAAIIKGAIKKLGDGNIPHMLPPSTVLNSAVLRTFNSQTVYEAFRHSENFLNMWCG